MSATEAAMQCGPHCVGNLESAPDRAVFALMYGRSNHWGWPAIGRPIVRLRPPAAGGVSRAAGRRTRCSRDRRARPIWRPGAGPRPPVLRLGPGASHRCREIACSQVHVQPVLAGPRVVCSPEHHRGYPVVRVVCGLDADLITVGVRLGPSQRGQPEVSQPARAGALDDQVVPAQAGRLRLICLATAFRRRPLPGSVSSASPGWSSLVNRVCIRRRSTRAHTCQICASRINRRRTRARCQIEPYARSVCSPCSMPVTQRVLGRAGAPAVAELVGR